MASRERNDLIATRGKVRAGADDKRAARCPAPMAVMPFISQTIVLPLTREAHAPF
jgi:hypothetical protein